MTAKVSLVSTNDRESGIRSAIELLGDDRPRFTDKNVILKPNFNSSDPFPASTHNDTTEAIIRLLQEEGASGITVGERSGGATIVMKWLTRNKSAPSSTRWASTM